MADVGSTLSKYTSSAELTALLESDKFGIYSADTYLALDGTTDDYTALYNLINTTINGNDAEIWFKDGTCLIGSSITIPSNVKLKFLNGGKLQPQSGVVITGSNAKIEAGQTQILDLSVSGVAGIAGDWDIKEANVKWFGATGDGSTDDTLSFNGAHAIISSTGGTIYVPDATGYKITSSIVCTKPVHWVIGSTTITASLTGYLFNIQANNSSIVGNRISELKADTGCTALIYNNQTLNCNYWNLKLELNNIANCVGLFHYGGWYLSAKNLWTDFEKEVASSYTLIVRSIFTGVPGDTGSYGGAYVSTYDNVIGSKVLIDTTLPQKTTTLTFTGCSLTSVKASDCVAITFLQPIIQGDGNFFDLTNVSGLTCMGGDFEITGANGQVYVLQDANCRDIVSVGNQTSGVTTSNYLIGTPAIGCVFDDKVITGAEDENLRYGSTPTFSLRNTGFDTKHRFGLPYNGDVLVASNNLKLISGTQGNLDDTSKNGGAIYIDTSGQVKVFYASAGSNPRTLTTHGTFDSNGLTLPTLRSSVGTAGQLWYDATDSNTIKYST